MNRTLKKGNKLKARAKAFILARIELLILVETIVIFHHLLNLKISPSSLYCHCNIINKSAWNLEDFYHKSKQKYMNCYKCISNNATNNNFSKL